jgi:Papain family cysteine protease
MSEPRETRVEKITTVPGMGRALIEHDPESRNYPVMGALVRQGVTRRNKTWRRSHSAYDQGQTSSCVGQTFRGVLNTSPLTAQIPLATRRLYPAMKIYENAQKLDQWPGEEPTYYGTSALGALRYLFNEGVIKEYRWCFGLNDVLDTLSAYGPVGIGVWWHDAMMGTDSRGFIKPVGQKIGGHEVELHGINIDSRYVIGTNSWGTDWGVNGRFKLSWDNLDLLLQDDGDAATVVK